MLFQFCKFNLKTLTELTILTSDGNQEKASVGFFSAVDSTFAAQTLQGQSVDYKQKPIY